MTDIQTSFSLPSTSKTAQQTDSLLLSFNGVAKLPGPNGTVILHHGQSNKRMVVRPDVASALELCSQYKPLLDHARLITQHLPALRGHTQSTFDTLTTIERAGFFESTEKAWHRLTGKTSTNKEQALCRIFVLTCDRPVLLRRLLTSLCSIYLNREDVEGIWIIDDSKDSKCINENTVLTGEFETEFKIPLTLFGHDQRRRYIEVLSRHLPEQTDSISFFLDSKPWGSLPTFGLARNWALLLSIGRRALIWDDDTIAEAISPPLASIPLKFGTANEREAIFYNSDEEMNLHARPEKNNPVSSMLSSLGESLNTILNKSNQTHSMLAGSDGETIRRFSAKSRVILTQCGSWGDPGTHSAQWLIYQPLESIKRLLESPKSLENLLRARSHWFGYRGTTLTSYGTLSQLTGLDNTNLLPPYLPAGRGEDILFGVMLQQMYPNSPVLNEGWSVRHRPIENRDNRGDLVARSVKPGLSMLTDWLGQEMTEYGSANPFVNLGNLSSRISKLITMQTDDLEILIQRQLISKQSAILKRLSNQITNLDTLGNIPGADPWKIFLEDSRNLIMSDLQTSQKNTLHQHFSKGNYDLGWIRSMGDKLCIGLKDWPNICEASKQDLI